MNPEGRGNPAFFLARPAGTQLRLALRFFVVNNALTVGRQSEGNESIFDGPHHVSR